MTSPTSDTRRWLAVLVLCLGQLMIVLDATVVNVALPQIQRDLDFTPASIAWVVNGYLIAFGGLLLLAGRLGDLLGRRRVFNAGIALFTAASVLCGLAPSAPLLIAARFLQGVGGAAAAAMVLGIVVTVFSDRRRTARAMSVYSAVAASGGAIGLLVGGALTQAAGWHWVFFVNVPFGAATLLLGNLLIPEHRGAGLHHGFDALGTVLVTAAPSLGIYTILQGSDSGWLTVRTGLLAAATLALAAGFVQVESRVRNPLVPLRIFRSRNVSGANAVRMLFPVGLFGSFFLGALYVQNVLGYSPLGTGLAFLPQSLAIATMSLLVAGRVVARIGARSAVIIGLSLITAGLALLSQAPVGATYLLQVLPVTVLVGAGAGLVFMPSVSLSMAEAGPADAGVVSGLANVAMQFGAALGIAVLFGAAADRSGALRAAGAGVRTALDGGYRLGFGIAAVCVLGAIAVAVLVLRPAARRPAVAEPVVEAALAEPTRPVAA